MSEYLFGLGPGHLPDVADEIARKHGAGLVNYTETQCNCGYGCRPYTCKKSQRHWFAGPNRGAPFDEQLSKTVMDALRAAGLV